MNKRFLSVIVFGTALLSVQAQDGQGGITSAMLSQIQQSYQGTASDKALRNAIGNNDIRKLALNQENMQGMDTHFSIKVDSKGITDLWFPVFRVLGDISFLLGPAGEVQPFPARHHRHCGKAVGRQNSGVAAETSAE